MNAARPTVTAAQAQVTNRLAAFQAIETAERHLALGATSPRQLERLADAILAADGHEVPTATRERLAAEAREAKRLKAERCAIDHAARQVRGILTASTRRPTEAQTSALVAEILAPAPRRTVSRQERAEATRLADKLVVRVTVAKLTGRPSAAAKAVKAQRAREAAIAAGQAVVLDAVAWENTCWPTRSDALLWDACKSWDDPNAGLRFITGW
jgi:hypothetical protein